ncbi:uncharacterized protein B0H64DRAFT_388922 [Chaetomium fimeti]|uniref:Uncharacterized protein n=1 Tax=Chaetomium fimeti TaxID=1854472 RepID=A0AAE0HN38_9PEZI|nr:hypothetical protein B0H64DRAFT_388922 [Chaetomium fimeti]
MLGCNGVPTVASALETGGASFSGVSCGLLLVLVVGAAASVLDSLTLGAVSAFLLVLVTGLDVFAGFELPFLTTRAEGSSFGLGVTACAAMDLVILPLVPDA